MQDIKKETLFGLASILVIMMIIGTNVYEYKKQSSTVAPTQSQKIDNAIVLTLDEIKKHNSQSDCWLLIEKKVYDATLYLNRHPGGAFRIMSFCGADATEAFKTQGGQGSHSGNAMQALLSLYIGDLNGKQTTIPNTNTINLRTPNSDDN